MAGESETADGFADGGSRRAAPSGEFGFTLDGLGVGATFGEHGREEVTAVCARSTSAVLCLAIHSACRQNFASTSACFMSPRARL